MIWTAFEIAVNIFQGLLLLMYVKQGFVYEKKHPAADVLLVALCAGFLTLFLFVDMPNLYTLLYVFPIGYTLLFSTEHKGFILYWMAMLGLFFGMISVITYPIFDLLPQVLRFSFPSYLSQRFLCITATQILLYIMLRLLIHLKKECPLPGKSSYAAFLLLVSALFLTEESLYALFLRAGAQAPVPFLLAYLGLIAFALTTVLLFRMVSADADRKNRDQAEIAMLRLSRQHQQELSQMYEDLTRRQHDYRHHLQTLQQLVAASGEESAKAYLETVLHGTDGEEMIVTGSPETDALLTAKRRLIHAEGVAFRFTPYPLANLPVSTADFCVLTGNLLDNALEGILRMPSQPADAAVSLAFSRSWNMFYIYCENPCDPRAVAAKQGRFVTSKKQDDAMLHGLGLRSIEAIAARAQGRAEFCVEGNTFKAKIVLPYPPPESLRVQLYRRRKPFSLWKSASVRQ